MCGQHHQEQQPLLFGHGRECQPAHDQALRPAEGTDHAGAGRENSVVIGRITVNISIVLLLFTADKACRRRHHPGGAIRYAAIPHIQSELPP